MGMVHFAGILAHLFLRTRGQDLLYCGKSELILVRQFLNPTIKLFEMLIWPGLTYEY